MSLYRTTMTVADAFKQARELILNDELAKTAIVYTHGARSMSTADLDSKQYRIESFVGILLSPQSPDTITHKVVQSLKSNIPNGLTAESLNAIDETDLLRLMASMNLNKTKASRLKKCAAIFVDKYDGDIPSTYKELLDLPGVGPKVGKLVLEVCWQRGEGIPIDTHGHRIANRIGWVTTNQAEKTGLHLENLIPKVDYHLVNEPLVALGQTYCTAKMPKCEICPIRHLCNYNSHTPGQHYSGLHVQPLAPNENETPPTVNIKRKSEESGDNKKTKVRKHIRVQVN